MLRRTDLPVDRFERHHAELLDSCSAYLAVAPPGARFSHLTAARLLTIPIPWQLERRQELHVMVPEGAQPPRMNGVIGHRGRESDIIVQQGLPVVSPETAWVQLAQFLTVDELVIAGDHLIRRKRPLSHLDRLTAVVEGLHRARGAVKLRLALPDLRSGTDSPKESETRLVLVRGGLPEPVIGHTVYHEGGFVGTPDLAYVKERIALDYEGDIHRTDSRVFREDVARREQFQDADWHYIRVVQAHLDAPHTLVALASRALARRASTV